MDGRTAAECAALQAEARDDERRADALYDDDPERASYLYRRAAWKRYLGDGHNRSDD